MQKVTNPIIWLARFRHRKGYGVHSPFAFRFITDVIYERTPYYAYAEQDKALPLSMRFRKRKGLHLLLRLANHLQPETIEPKELACCAAPRSALGAMWGISEKSDLVRELSNRSVQQCDGQTRKVVSKFSKRVADRWQTNLVRQIAMGR